jgi:hypothetical protein
MPGHNQVLGFRVRVDYRLHCLGPIGGRDAGTSPVLSFDGYRESCAEIRCIVIRHHRYLQLIQSFADNRHANQAPTVNGHEIDGFRRNRLGSHNQVALVLTVLVVHDDNEFTGFYIFNCFRNC